MAEKRRRILQKGNNDGAYQLHVEYLPGEVIDNITE